LVLALFAGWLWYWVSRKPTISRNFTAEFNAATLGADKDSLAWPGIRRALIDLPDEPEALWKLNYEQHGGGWTEVKPGDSYWDAVRQYVEMVQPNLATIRTCAARQCLGYLLTDADDAELANDGWRRSRTTPDAQLKSGTANPAMIDVNLPFIGKFRYCARLLRLDGRVAIERRQPERVISNVESLFDISRLARQNSGVIGHMMSGAVDSMTLQLVAEALESSPTFFDSTQLKRLDAIIRDRAGKQSLDAALAFDRAMFEDALQRSFTDNGSGNGRVTYDGLYTWGDPDPKPGQTHWDRILLGLLIGDRKAQLDHYDSAIRSARADMKVPAWEYDGPSEATNELFKPPGLVNGMRPAPALIYLPSMTKVAVVRWQIDELIGATRCLIALHLYRNDQGRWPASLTELLPDYLAAVPIDRFDGKPLRYRVDGDHLLLYSVGINREDDGGKPAPNTQYASEWIGPSKLESDPRFQPGRHTAWDNIFFPPSRANEPAPSDQPK
jgi:hypothetical protein